MKERFSTTIPTGRGAQIGGSTTVLSDCQVETEPQDDEIVEQYEDSDRSSYSFSSTMYLSSSANNPQSAGAHEQAAKRRPRKQQSARAASNPRIRASELLLLRSVLGATVEVLVVVVLGLFGVVVWPCVVPGRVVLSLVVGLVVGLFVVPGGRVIMRVDVVLPVVGRRVVPGASVVVCLSEVVVCF